MKKILIVLLFAPLVTCAETKVLISPISNETWSAELSPYILERVITVPTGVTLTIEPGTVVKAASGGGAGLMVRGNLVAIGSESEPIIFTSGSDDTVGGDTNGDATSTIPQAGDWQGIGVYEGATAEISNVEIRYAGHGGYGYGEYAGLFNMGGELHANSALINSSGPYGILNKSGLLDVSNVTVRGSEIGISITSGTTTITHSTFDSNRQFGVSSQSKDPLVLTHNTFMGNGKAAIVDIASDFIHEGNTSSDISNRGIQVGGQVRADTTLYSRDLPLIVMATIDVARNSTLTIGSGTTIKFGPSAGLIVNGVLEMGETDADPITMTTLLDDTVAGDTNGDADATAPPAGFSHGDWMGIVFNPGARGHITNSELRYGGATLEQGYYATLHNLGAEVVVDRSIFRKSMQMVLHQSSGTTTIASSVLTNNTDVARATGGNLTITNSDLSQNAGYAVLNTGGAEVDARNNWWGREDGPRVEWTSTSTASLIAGEVQYEPWLLSTPTSSSTTPTVDLPGDTTLVGTSTPVIVIPGILGSAEKNGVWIIDPILHTYDNLLATFRSGGYLDEKTLFTFPYDWRKSNIDTAHLLASKIDEVKQICECNKVNLVAHSMGGLVARAYIASTDYKSDINQLIFLGTPHTGAVTDYLIWEGGEFPPTFQSIVTKFYFSHQAKELGYNSLFEYVRDYPIRSVEELLPITDYIRDSDNPLYRSYPDNYPRNTFLEELSSKKENLLSSGIRIKNYVGESGTDTIMGVRTVDSPSGGIWEHGYPEGFGNILGDRGLMRGAGDGTVPTDRAQFLGSADTMIAANHTALPTQAAAKVYEDLTGTSTIGVSVTLPKSLLMLQALSPINILLTSPSGQRFGYDAYTGGEFNEIPGAFYSGADADAEFITVPDPEEGEYILAVVGTGVGEYTTVSSLISDDSTMSTSHTSDTTVGEGEVVRLAVEPNGSIEESPVVVPPVESAPEQPQAEIPVSLSRSNGSSRHAMQTSSAPLINYLQLATPGNKADIPVVFSPHPGAVAQDQQISDIKDVEMDNVANVYTASSKLSYVWAVVSAWVMHAMRGLLAFIGLI